jgi:acyl-CoA dehydrogenase
MVHRLCNAGPEGTPRCHLGIRVREQFGQPIADSRRSSAWLADMAVEIEAMRLLTYKAAWLIDQGTTAPIVSSYAKAFGADLP